MWLRPSLSESVTCRRTSGRTVGGPRSVQHKRDTAMGPTHCGRSSSSSSLPPGGTNTFLWFVWLQARLCRSIFGFVLLSACADFTVCTVATHPRSPAWHRRLRKRRQIARRRLRQHCATPADCWRIATHHGSCLPGPMTWSCPVCGTVNHDNRRTCTVRDCRHRGGPPSAWDNRRGTRHGSRTRTSASSASRRWTCPECSHQNYAWRGYCHSCSRAVSLGERGNGGGGSPARKPAQRATFGDVLFVGVRKVARLRLSQLRGDGSQGFGSSQSRGARPPEGFGCEHCESREGARRQAGCGYRRGSSAEEAGETGAQGSAAVPQVYQCSSQKRRSQQGKRLSSSSRVCRRKRWSCC